MSPDAAALFLEALDPETLAILGRAALLRECSFYREDRNVFRCEPKP